MARSKKCRRGAATAMASVDDAIESTASAEAPAGELHQAPPPASPDVTHANGDAAAAAAAEPDEPKRDSDGDAERLKHLNGILVSAATEERKRVAALEARLADLAADADALADGERGVLLAAVAATLRSAEEERAALLERVAAAAGALERAREEAAREAGACADAAARLQAAVAENEKLVEGIRAKEGEAAAAAQRVAVLQDEVAGLRGQVSDLLAERSEFESRLEAVRASARAVQSEKEVLESSFNEFKKEHEIYKQAMEAKLEGGQFKELEALQSRKVELEAKVGSLEAELSEAVARKHELELEVEKLEAEIAAAKVEEKKLKALLVEVDQKQIVLEADVARLRREVDQVLKENKDAAVAHEDERKMVEAELEKLKANVNTVQAEKDGAIGMVHAKEAEAAKLGDELKKLRCSMAELRARCDNLDLKSSSLQEEKILVLKQLEQEKAEAEKLKLRIQELESNNGDNDREIGILKAQVGDRDNQINELNEELEQLQLAVAEAQHRGNNVVWTWLGPATTTVLAAASFVYAARSR